MKKITLLSILCVVFASIIISCSSDSSSAASTESILGRWSLEKRGFTSDGVTTPEYDYENNNPGCVTHDYMEFKTLNAFENGYYNPDCSITPNVGAEWTKAGNLITITDPEAETYIFELLSVTTTELKMRINMTGTEGVEPGVVLYINYTLKKV